jgi:hypothetical protein
MGTPETSHASDISLKIKNSKAILVQAICRLCLEDSE